VAVVDQKWVDDWLAHLGLQQFAPIDQLMAVLSELVTEVEDHQTALPFIGNHVLIELANSLATRSGLREPFRLRIGDGGGFMLTIFQAAGGGSVGLALPRRLTESQGRDGTFSERVQILANLRAWQRYVERHRAKAAAPGDNALAVKQKGSRSISEGAAATPEATMPKHSTDFTSVTWYGTEYAFALGVQSSAVRALWEEWTESGLGLHQNTIRNAIDAERDNFRMDTAFRNHPAFGTMIQRCGDGRYKLAPPRADVTPAGAGKAAAGKITPKSRRKRV
jgi:hypothetical protein